ncbi:MAG: NAD(P)/FAD-dependent oxidoreductase [Deltaproteobacteria bacterium]|nr:NAD(P)/FAD-dependent oxidoreductase [Deltaproteobacteria bacterium]MCB9787432.1 NAD(P)/FAD-dependent oxidoreductase [Deltaproteobacteria bacterium]
MPKVVIIGGGFAGLNAARALGGVKDVEVTLIDRRNHHLFQPLLYQVATAGLSPAEIAAPIRALVSDHENVRVLCGAVARVLLAERRVEGEFGTLEYDHLVVATGTEHTYFGHEDWEPFAPGLKTLAQATEIRRRVLEAFEAAERIPEASARKRLLTFVVVGGGPTGVELAGAIAEMSRFTLARDFRRIDPKLTRVVLLEGTDRVLPSFAPELASRAVRDLERMGVQVWTSSMVTGVDARGVDVGSERIESATVVWAAGVRASPLGATLGVPLDKMGRVRVEADLSVPGHPEVFVVGDLAHAEDEDGKPLPGLAPVALQQGRHVAAVIRATIEGKERKPFHYRDKGQMATVGRSRAILQSGKLRIGGFFAWLAWLVVHIYYLSGFRNRILVLIRWAWAYVSYHRGARLITDRDWRAFPPEAEADAAGEPPSELESTVQRTR